MDGNSLEAIHKALPHRAPMLLVDRIVEQTEDSILCEKEFREDEFFFQGHYPDFPICPGVILCECGAQTGAILLSGLVDEGQGVPVLTKMDAIRFKRMVRPGETIRIQVKLDDQISGAFYLTAQIKCDDKVAARFSFVCTVAPKAQSDG